MSLRETPGTVSESNRHRRPWREGSRTPLVPLLDPHPQGQWHQGLIRVPTRLAEAEKDTNEFHALQKKINEDVDKWVRWRQMRGWQLTTRPLISGPYPPQVEDSLAEADPDQMWYFVMARFSRLYPAYIKLEDHLENMRKAEVYGVDIEKDTLPWNDPSQVYGDSGWVDPMQHARQRREKLGINVNDHVMPRDDLGIPDPTKMRRPA